MKRGNSTLAAEADDHLPPRVAHLRQPCGGLRRATRSQSPPSAWTPTIAGRVDATIDLELKRKADRAQIVIRDSGEPVPPWARALAETAALDCDPLDLDALPAGGSGLAMAIAAMDHFDYEEKIGANVTRLGKALHADD